MEDIEKLKIENEKLKKLNTDKSDLISLSAHKLRTSLSALKWTLKMFVNKDLGDINDEQKKYMEKAITSNEKAINLVNYLLTFNHSDDVSIKLNLKQINIVTLVDKIIPLFKGELKNKNINLIFNKTEKSIPYINMDEEMITNVIQNLIENAIKYSLSNSEIFIKITENISNNNIEFSIHDNGIGIKEIDKSKIFNKFFRAPNAIEKENTGSGLGLFTTKNIIEKHNGQIWFESSNKQGTTFFVSLPVNLTL